MKIEIEYETVVETIVRKVEKGRKHIVEFGDTFIGRVPCSRCYNRVCYVTDIKDNWYNIKMIDNDTKDFILKGSEEKMFNGLEMDYLGKFIPENI